MKVNMLYYERRGRYKSHWPSVTDVTRNVTSALPPSGTTSGARVAPSNRVKNHA